MFTNWNDVVEELKNEKLHISLKSHEMSNMLSDCLWIIYNNGLKDELIDMVKDRYFEEEE